MVLTLDNLQLSGPKIATDEVEIEPVAAAPAEGNNVSLAFSAINGSSELAASIQDFVEAGIPPATRRAYRADLDHFCAWGGVIPSTDAQLAGYLAAHSATLAVATLVRRLAAISVAHEAHGLPNPVRMPLVRSTMRGIRRTRGSAQRQAKPLLRDDLFGVLAATAGSLKDMRDRALLLIGFAGGFRRSELCDITCSDIERVRQGIVVTIRSSKTDQDGVGRKIGIPLGRSKWCPVTALEGWLAAAGIADGPIFRRVDRHSRVSAEGLSAEAVCLIVRERVKAAGFDPSGYSGHSLRAGLATSAVQADVSTLKIRNQTGHASDAMLARYVRGRRAIRRQRGWGAAVRELELKAAKSPIDPQYLSPSGVLGCRPNARTARAICPTSNQLSGYPFKGSRQKVRQFRQGVSTKYIKNLLHNAR